MEKQKLELLNMNMKELNEFFISIGCKTYNIKQFLEWIYKKNELDFSKMSNFSLDLRKTLDEKSFLYEVELVKYKESRDGTSKYLFKLSDDSLIETVLIPTEKRNTICLSSQVGCKFNCLFCASGKIKFKRNLTQSEILSQILFIKKHKNLDRVSNVVFMGVGEPLDNFDNVVSAIKIINNKDCFNIGARKIVISTCGLVPEIKKLSEIDMQVELAVSLHAVKDGIRNKLVPINKKYSISKLMEACKGYCLKTNRQITFEYLMIKDFNDSIEYASILVNLLKDFCSKVNIIKYNKIPNLDFKASDSIQIGKFIDVLEKNKIPVTVRFSRGADIMGACGQLMGEETNSEDL